MTIKDHKDHKPPTYENGSVFIPGITSNFTDYKSSGVTMISNKKTIIRGHPENIQELHLFSSGILREGDVSPAMIKAAGKFGGELIIK